MTSSLANDHGYSVRSASWQADNTGLCAVREQVFIQEQHVPVELEWDGEDETALHVLAESPDGKVIGTARMLEDGHIGRVAVLPAWRGRGIGSELMRALLRYAEQAGLKSVYLDAQVDAIDFYARLGFSASGDVFMDAGIPHRHMRLILKA